MGRHPKGGSPSLQGETTRAARIVDDAGIEKPAGETVLVQGRDSGVRATDADFRRAFDEVVEAVQGTGAVTNVKSPYDPGAKTVREGRGALTSF